MDVWHARVHWGCAFKCRWDQGAGPRSLSHRFTNDARILLRPVLQHNVIDATLVGAIMNDCSNKTKCTPEILQVLAVWPLGFDLVRQQWRPREKGTLFSDPSH